MEELDKIINKPIKEQRDLRDEYYRQAEIVKDNHDEYYRLINLGNSYAYLVKCREDYGKAQDTCHKLKLGRPGGNVIDIIIEEITILREQLRGTREELYAMKESYLEQGLTYYETLNQKNDLEQANKILRKIIKEDEVLGIIEKLKNDNDRHHLEFVVQVEKLVECRVENEELQAENTRLKELVKESWDASEDHLTISGSKNKDEWLKSKGI